MVRQNPHIGHTPVMQLNHRAFKHVFSFVRVPSLPAPKKILTEEQKQEIERFWNLSTDATELTNLFNAEKQQP